MQYALADEERNTPAFEAHIYHRSSWPPFLLSPMGKAARTMAATTRRRRLAMSLAATLMIRGGAAEAAGAMARIPLSSPPSSAAFAAASRPHHCAHHCALVRPLHRHRPIVASADGRDDAGDGDGDGSGSEGSDGEDGGGSASYALGAREAPAHLRQFPPSDEQDDSEGWNESLSTAMPGVVDGKPNGNVQGFLEPARRPDPHPDEGLQSKGHRPVSYNLGMGKNGPVSNFGLGKTRKLYHVDEEGEFLSRAVGNGEEGFQMGFGRVEDEDEVWQLGMTEQNDTIDEVTSSSPPPLPQRGDPDSSAAVSGSRQERGVDDSSPALPTTTERPTDFSASVPPPPVRFEDMDLFVPLSVYDPDNGIDLAWDLMRYEARVEAEREPILVSFLHSTILNHPTLESAIAFHLANKLSSPAMIATQIMTLIRESLADSPDFRRSLRADILAVRDRDPACTCLPDVFLYFKGFHALQTHRVGHHLWHTGRTVLAHFLQSQVSQTFQIDIHPAASLGPGIMLDHGTGIVIGETARVGRNCSILHHVTLGGSGKKGVDRHPKLGDGVLLGAGSTMLGNITLGDGCQVGAGTLVISDLPPHSVAVGVPAKIIGSFIDVKTQPSQNMNQLGTEESDETITFESDGI